ncbi:MAG TPA: hypothetical protein VNM66_03625, partial [Thermodesulfobacteriota bacterium]|nr:hypothetical protein [Thermodesulfobacteriota bacterium]
RTAAGVGGGRGRSARVVSRLGRVRPGRLARPPLLGLAAAAGLLLVVGVGTWPLLLRPGEESREAVVASVEGAEEAQVVLLAGGPNHPPIIWVSGEAVELRERSLQESSL